MADKIMDEALNSVSLKRQHDEVIERERALEAELVKSVLEKLPPALAPAIGEQMPGVPNHWSVVLGEEQGRKLRLEFRENVFPGRNLWFVSSDGLAHSPTTLVEEVPALFFLEKLLAVLTSNNEGRARAVKQISAEVHRLSAAIALIREK